MDTRTLPAIDSDLADYVGRRKQLRQRIPELQAELRDALALCEQQITALLDERYNTNR